MPPFCLCTEPSETPSTTCEDDVELSRDDDDDDDDDLATSESDSIGAAVRTRGISATPPTRERGGRGGGTVNHIASWLQKGPKMRGAFHNGSGQSPSVTDLLQMMMMPFLVVCRQGTHCSRNGRRANQGRRTASTDAAVFVVSTTQCHRPPRGPLALRHPLQDHHAPASHWR